MNAIRRIVFITQGYPSVLTPNWYTFVRQFVHAAARQGVTCTVVHPIAFHRVPRRVILPYRSTESLHGGPDVVVLRPRFASFSARAWFTRFGPFNPSRWTFRSFTKAALAALQREDVRPDAVYGHFLYLGGAAAVRIGQALHVPSFSRVGEGEFRTIEAFGDRRAQQDMSGATAFIANSMALERLLVERLGVNEDRIGVFPNGTDLTRFRPHDKAAARKRFGVPAETFVTAFVGRYVNEKGAARLAMALDGLEGVGGIFAGEGPFAPSGKNLLFSQPLSHADIPEFLSAADVFVLPTLAEGCCNAIIEAMACGLPIISSKGEFNDQLLDVGMSLRVDPLDVAQLRAAIILMRDNPALRQRMSEAALARAKLFNVDNLAHDVLKYMNEKAACHEDHCIA